ncbi:hypothetical protein [Mangrovibacterium sp.]|uniref:hypothetical protein n=1 Tax=Mangrovibacterium sp. TaxID=1961364 RepID=UPI00356ACF91
MNSQLKSLIAHFSLVGWVVAIIMNDAEKEPQCSFYLRQTLGIYLVALLGAIVPGLRITLGIVAIILWVVSLIGVVQNRETEIPVLGVYFQEWFKGIR